VISLHPTHPEDHGATRWLLRVTGVILAILVAGCLFGVTGCMVVKPVVGTGVAVTKTAGKAVGKTVGTAAGAVVGGDDEPEKTPEENAARR